MLKCCGFIFYLLVKSTINIQMAFLLSEIESVELISLPSVCNNNYNVNMVQFVLSFYVIKCILNDSAFLYFYSRLVAQKGYFTFHRSGLKLHNKQ